MGIEAQITLSFTFFKSFMLKIVEIQEDLNLPEISDFHSLK